ncbi:3-oxoacyl-[acyl-carrier-protein] reductase [Ligilactobacillus aviarius]|uniref:3-oxoacyl-[acyl-carrier-protein] reductase n=1 Tax=Ligilactobacillus aviarius TaxID=1606 RepID=A0A179CTG2_9LACO|nr:3-oxoacyl-[acyl-carrier-protein] reductase [Ligilactobacillus aviarius]OAQ00236.1 beta-ketoacyl-ACP reductase [Ligilactobacillus aviarius]OAQ00513.1 beta-ketoacyl-ACP reductase [Ligilactobacillus aviarius]OAQ01319.1 beta-ketoacyl-ACP reductase [Ligilactobacillus aviarius]OAQ01859.1 beta-ketoacyl-ACP reductase [Ligilactobacillus aviarius]OAQ04776.1 beta-ketoacyl-ACP reductase [Ligilactobacillus aviarius]
MDLTGKNVLVTGSSRGLGAAIAVKFAEHGANVILNARHEPTELIQQIKNLGVQVWFIQADISSPRDIEEMVHQLDDHQIDVDILVNNAGINRDKLMIGMREKDFDDVVNTNLIGTFRVTQPLFKRMLKRRSGVIINMASVVGEHGNIGQANYAASKAGVIGFTKAVAQEGALRGVRCNAIAPGMIASSMTAAIDEKRQKEIKERIPLKRLGTAEEVAQTALFLAQNDYLTGEIINVDGGMAM